MGQDAKTYETGARKQYGLQTGYLGWVADVLISPFPESVPTNTIDHLQFDSNSKPSPTHSNSSQRSRKSNTPQESTLDEGGPEENGPKHNMTNDSDARPSPPASTTAPKTPTKKTTGVNSQILRGVRDPDTGDFVPTPTVSAGPQGSATDASPSSTPATDIRRLTRGKARALGVVVQPELAKHWNDHEKPFFLFKMSPSSRQEADASDEN